MAKLLHVRDGEPTRLVVYYYRNRALADLGLSAEGRLSVMVSASLDLARSICRPPGASGAAAHSRVKRDQKGPRKRKKRL